LEDFSGFPFPLDIFGHFLPINVTCPTEQGQETDRWARKERQEKFLINVYNTDINKQCGRAVILNNIT
jgi:hypothetical protein